jgi:cyclopropane-fatty-acyl-phospholipid synthase
MNTCANGRTPPPAVEAPKRSRALDSSTAKRLIKDRIFPWGSQEQRLFEQRLLRYFTREYRQLAASNADTRKYDISTDEGPMWRDTAELMERHFDQSLELFRCFLDHKYMAYTTAYYGETPEQIRGSTFTLEDAERAKFELVARRAGVRGNEQVFNLGCGFGPLETYLFEKHPNIEITSITPSRVQAEYVRQQSKNPEHPLSRGKLRLIEDDFGRVPIRDLGEQQYQIVFAVGAFEHVNNLDRAMERIASILRPNGTAFIHLIVSIPFIPRFFHAEKTMIREYFPGGRIWPFDILKQQTKYLSLEGSWFINGINYWRTLDCWHRNFWENMGNVYQRILGREGVRYWNNYFSLSKACFAPFDGIMFGNGQYLFRKRSR